MVFLKSLCSITAIFLILHTGNVVFSENKQTSPDSNNGQIIKLISAEKAREIIEEHKGSDKFVVIDLRTHQEYEQEHIEDSENIDFYSENFRNYLGSLDKDNTYIIHCRSGSRAGKTVPILKELGFKEVYNMGGIIQWKEAGFETIKPTE